MVLFFNLKCWETVFPILTNLALSLEGQGIESHQIICAPRWKCDALRPVKPDPPNCAWGRERLLADLNSKRLPYSSLEDYGDGDLRARAGRMAESLARETRPAYDGIALEEVIKASLARYLRCLYDPAQATHQLARRQFFRDAVCCIEAIGKILDHWRPEAIVVWGGTFYAERIAAILARRRGMRVIAVENTAFRDRIYVDGAGVTGNRHSAAHNWHWLESRVLTPQEQQRLYGYLNTVHAGDSSWIPQPNRASREELCARLGIAADRRLALLIGQVAIDSVVVMDSPVFAEMREFIVTTAEIMAGHPEYHLVVRLHPAEAMWHDDLTLRRLADWKRPANCSIVHSQEMNTYDLMRESELGITICSQAGLEMLSMGKPVVTAGRAFYAGKGLTHDVTSRAAYPAVLEEALKKPRLTHEQREGVEKLLYHLIFEHLAPFDRDGFSVTAQGIEMLVNQGAFAGLARAREMVDA